MAENELTTILVKWICRHRGKAIPGLFGVEIWVAAQLQWQE
jgi:hypothetical protein